MAIYRKPLNFRPDAGTLEMLDVLCARFKLSRSNVLRKRVPHCFQARAPPTCFAGFPRIIARGDLRATRYPGTGGRGTRVTIRDLDVPEFLGRNHLTLWRGS